MSKKYRGGKLAQQRGQRRQNTPAPPRSPRRRRPGPPIVDLRDGALRSGILLFVGLSITWGLAMTSQATFATEDRYTAARYCGPHPAPDCRQELSATVVRAWTEYHGKGGNSYWVSLNLANGTFSSLQTMEPTDYLQTGTALLVEYWQNQAVAAWDDRGNMILPDSNPHVRADFARRLIAGAGGFSLVVLVVFLFRLRRVLRLSPRAVPLRRPATPPQPAPVAGARPISAAPRSLPGTPTRRLNPADLTMIATPVSRETKTNRLPLLRS